MNLEEIKAREQAATPGPWYDFGDWMIHTESDVEHYGVPGKKVIGTVNKNNAAFIAHARTDIPALLAEVERLTGKLQTLTGIEAQEHQEIATLKAEKERFEKALELACNCVRDNSFPAISEIRNTDTFILKSAIIYQVAHGPDEVTHGEAEK